MNSRRTPFRSRFRPNGPKTRADRTKRARPAQSAGITIGIEATGSHDTGICPCCGQVSRVVWGNALVDERAVAVYYVHWTLGGLRDHGAHFDLILGKWHEGAAVEDRRAVSLACRLFESGPSLMVIDAQGRSFAASPIAGVPLARAEVIGTPLAPFVFALCDAIWLQDGRLGELTGAPRD